VMSMPSSIQPKVLAARARRSREELEARNARGFEVIRPGSIPEAKAGRGDAG
jgi:hypothetical protein